MITRQTGILAVTTFVLLIAMFSAAGAAEEKTGDKTQTGAAMTQQQAAPVPIKIMGTVIANKNDKGKITSYELQEDSGQAMVISQHGSGMELRRMVGARIEATGTVYEDKGEKTIIVNEFKKIK